MILLYKNLMNLEKSILHKEEMIQNFYKKLMNWRDNIRRVIL